MRWLIFCLVELLFSVWKNVGMRKNVGKRSLIHVRAIICLVA